MREIRYGWGNLLVGVLPSPMSNSLVFICMLLSFLLVLVCIRSLLPCLHLGLCSFSAELCCKMRNCKQFGPQGLTLKP